MLIQVLVNYQLIQVLVIQSGLVNYQMVQLEVLVLIQVSAVR